MNHSRIDAGGRFLSASFRGQGSPLVVLENGFIAESDSWKAVAEGIAGFTRVCVYDRAGRGASDAAAHPRRAADLLGDLHAIVHAREAGSGGGALLVGQSFGGLLVRLYAHRHPTDVAGLVLVDSLHEDQFETMGASFPEYHEGEPPVLSGMRAFWRGGWRQPEGNKEGIDLLDCQEQAHAIGTLGKLPLAVLTAGSYTFRSEQSFPGEVGASLQRQWVELHRRLTLLSTDVTWEVAEDSGHFMHIDRPELVVATVKALVARLRGESAPRS